MRGHRRRHRPKVVTQRRIVLDRDLADAHRQAEAWRRAGFGRPAQKSREVLEVGGRSARALAAEPAQPVAHIGRIVHLAHLAVGDHVEPRGDLPAHRFVDRLRRARGQGGRSEGGVAALAGVEHLAKVGRARQASDVRRQDAVSGRPHDPSPPRWRSRPGQRRQYRAAITTEQLSRELSADRARRRRRSRPTRSPVRPRLPGAGLEPSGTPPPAGPSSRSAWRRGRSCPPRCSLRHARKARSR